MDNIVDKILGQADVSTQQGIDQLQKDMNLAVAGQISLQILSMDYRSAQLRLIHSSHLRDGNFDAERIQLIISLLYDIRNTVERIIPLAHTLQPTVFQLSIAPEKET